MSSVVVNRNIKTLHEALRLTAAAVKDAAVVADVVYRQQEKTLFSTQGGSGGVPWKALSKEYKERKDRLFSRTTATIKGIAKARGNKLAGFALHAAVGSENKILQLTGDMKRAFSEAGGEHVAEGFILPQGARIQVGARGPSFYRMHATGDGKLPRRNQQQRTSTQDAQLVEGVRRALIPHVMRSLRVALRTGAPK